MSIGSPTQKVRSFTLIFTMTCIIFACDETAIDPLMEQILIELVTMDDEMNEKAEFNRGANVVLMVKATNSSDTEIVLSDFSACSVLNDPEFTEIYTIINNQKFLIGRSLQNQPYYCLAIYMPRKIPAGESIYLAGARWKNNPNNTDLPPGKYYSKYVLQLNGREFHTEVEFSVK